MSGVIFSLLPGFQVPARFFSHNEWVRVEFGLMNLSALAHCIETAAAHTTVSFGKLPEVGEDKTLTLIKQTPT